MKQVKNKNNIAKRRYSNFELLRILSMFAIVMGHMYWQAFDNEVVSLSGNLFEIVFCSGARIAVNIYLMIGVWFMYDTEFKSSRVLKLYGSLWFYSVSITILLLIVGIEVGLKDVISAFFPFLRLWMWFVPIYMSLILLFPFLKLLADKLNRGGMKLLVTIGFVMISIACSVYSFMDTRLCSLLWFIYIYFVIGYYKKYVSMNIKNNTVFLFIGIAIYLLLVIGKIVGSYNEGKIYYYVLKIVTQYLSDFKSVPNFICSLCIFIYFSKLDIGTIPFINVISRNTLDVYLIHQQTVFYPILWSVICRCHDWQESRYFILIFIGVAIGVYIGCSVIGFLRTLLIEPLWIKSKLYNEISTKIDKLYSFIPTDK